MENGKTVQELILKSIGELRQDVKGLDSKVDRKMDLISQRITEENTATHNRITLEETKRIRTEAEVNAVKGRVNWLYVIAGGMVITLAGSVVAIMMNAGG